MIGGAENEEKSSLPRIEEDVYRSSDSFSTIGGESLESLEAGLFEDIRASIQRSSKVPYAMKSSGDTSGSESKETQTVNCKCTSCTYPLHCILERVVSACAQELRFIYLCYRKHSR